MLHVFYFWFHDTLSAKFHQRKPSKKRICFLARRYSIFLKISLKSSSFFFLEKLSGDLCCENPIHKIQKSTDLYKSWCYRISVMRIKSFRSSFLELLSRTWFRFYTLMIYTQPLAHPPPPKAYKIHKRGLRMLQLALFFPKNLRHPHPYQHPPPHTHTHTHSGFVVFLQNQTPTMPKRNSLLSPCFFKKVSGILQSPPSISPSRYLLPNHWTKSNQILCVSCSYEWGVQRLWGGAKRSNIIKY